MATPHELTIPVSTLDAGGKAFHFPLRSAWLRTVLEDSGVGVGEDPAEEAGTLELRASRSGNDIVLHGRLLATLFTECARCTQPAIVHVDQPVTTLAVPASSVARPSPPKPKPKAEPIAAPSASSKPAAKPDARNDRARLTAGAHGPGGAALREKAAKEGQIVAEKAGRNGRARSDDNDLAEYEFSAEEADTLTYEGDTVVLDDFVRDELLLEIPMIPLCSEECAGIQPGPSSRAPDPSDLEAGGGEDARGVDPRLAPLLKLKLTKP
jgi:uncharacterized protein